jgi:hypothetical protein
MEPAELLQSGSFDVLKPEKQLMDFPKISDVYGWLCNGPAQMQCNSQLQDELLGQNGMNVHSFR